LRHERDQIVEARAIDAHADAVGERDQAQAAVRILRCAGHQELCERAPGGAALRQLLREFGALVEAHLAACDRGPVLLLVVVEVLRIDALPLAGDDAEAAPNVGCDGNEPGHRRKLAASPALEASPRGWSDARSLPVKVGIEQAVERDDALA